MAGDTREEPVKQASNSKGQTSNTGQDGQHSHKIYETFQVPSGEANAYRGSGRVNTAWGNEDEANFSTALKTVKVEDFSSVHKQPCVRDAILTGILGGFGLGGIRAVLGAPIPKASNWAVGTFCTVSFVAYEICQYKRQREIEGMKRAVEIIDRKKLEKENQIKEQRKRLREHRQAQDAEETRKSWSSWKFW